MKNIMLFLLALVATSSLAQEGTTFILIRHAEKAADDPKDPSLNEAGKERAVALAQLLGKADIKAIYSTDYKRTKSTVQPLAQAKGLEIQTYGWGNPTDMVKQWIAQHPGETIVISGHSNTTPVLANALLGAQQLANFDESDYGNVLVIFVDGSGKGRLLHLRF